MNPPSMFREMIQFVEKAYYVYTLCSDSGVLYVGTTINLVRRVYEHKHGVNEEFTKKYKIHRLVYFEETNDVWVAIRREKQIKKWRRSKKKGLIRTLNPQWRVLSAGWYED